MTHTLGDGRFWLPSEFLTDDYKLMDKENFHKNGRGLFLNPASGFNSCFPTESTREFGSLNSPVESVVSSTETDSDDDFLAALTRHLTLQETQKPISQPQNIEKTLVLSGSPQSTLNGSGYWSVSSNGSPNGPSLVSSPPATPSSRNDDAWRLINAAAGQVARLQISAGEAPSRSRVLLPPPRNQNLIYPSPPTTGFFANQSLSHSLTQSHTPHFQGKEEQGIKQQMGPIWGCQGKEGLCPRQMYRVGYGGGGGCGGGGDGGRPLELPQSAWPPLQVQHQNQQQHGGSGMRAVFLGGSGGGVKRESAGTGVFLPRRYGNPSDSRKKTGCSTALLPARVVHALNKNFEDMASRPQNQFHSPYTASLTSEYDGLMARRNALLAQQKRIFRSEVAANHEIQLPQEWTY